MRYPFIKITLFSLAWILFACQPAVVTEQSLLATQPTVETTTSLAIPTQTPEPTATPQPTPTQTPTPILLEGLVWASDPVIPILN